MNAGLSSRTVLKSGVRPASQSRQFGPATPCAASASTTFSCEISGTVNEAVNTRSNSREELSASAAKSRSAEVDGATTSAAMANLEKQTGAKW